jgi:hypothetical protein
MAVVAMTLVDGFPIFYDRCGISNEWISHTGLPEAGVRLKMQVVK